MCLILPTTPAFAHSILWVSTSDHTDLIKDEEYITAPAVLLMAPGVDEDASLLIEETDGGLEILYEEPGPPEELEQISTADEMELPPEELEEIELEENTNGEIQEP